MLSQTGIACPSERFTLKLLLFLPLISSTQLVISLAQQISDLCNPTCPPTMVCVEYTTVCTFEDCPHVRACVAPDHIPPHWRPAHSTATSAPRSGCPASLPGGPCVTQCHSDRDCGRGMLCCQNDCGRVCKPDTRVQVLPKRGTCPWYLNGMEESCDSHCLGDFDCPGLQKCCRTACGSSCVMPCFYWLSSSSLWRLSQRCDRASVTVNRSQQPRKRMSEPVEDPFESRNEIGDDLYNPETRRHRGQRRRHHKSHDSVSSNNNNSNMINDDYNNSDVRGGARGTRVRRHGSRPTRTRRVHSGGQ